MNAVSYYIYIAIGCALVLVQHVTGAELKMGQRQSCFLVPDVRETHVEAVVPTYFLEGYPEKTSKQINKNKIPKLKAVSEIDDGQFYLNRLLCKAGLASVLFWAAATPTSKSEYDEENTTQYVMMFDSALKSENAEFKAQVSKLAHKIFSAMETVKKHSRYDISMQQLSDSQEGARDTFLELLGHKQLAVLAPRIETLSLDQLVDLEEKCQSARKVDELSTRLSSFFTNYTPSMSAPAGRGPDRRAHWELMRSRMLDEINYKNEKQDVINTQLLVANSRLSKEAWLRSLVRFDGTKSMALHIWALLMYLNEATQKAL